MCSKYKVGVIKIENVSKTKRPQIVSCCKRVC